MGLLIDISEYCTKIPTPDSSHVGGNTTHEVDSMLEGRTLTEGDRRHLESIKEYLSIHILEKGLAITTTSHIGMANFSNFSVKVEPKIFIKPENLYGMINYAFGIDDLKKIPDEFLPKTNENYLMDLIIQAFVKHCEILFKYGLYKSYVTYQDNISFLRGKLLLKQHLQNVLRSRPKFACEYDELEYDNLENQILLFCLNRSYKITQNPILKSQLRKLIFQLSSVVSDKYITRQDFKKINYTRQNDHYKTAHELCEIIIESAGVVDMYSGTKHLIQSFFVDMNVIFEKFVYKLFEKVFSDRYRVNEQKQRKVWTIEEEKDRSMRTDILLEAKHSDETIVIDTKYKENLSVADLYQIGFYIHEYAKKGVKNVQKVGFAVLPTEKILPEAGKSLPFFSETQKIAVVKSYININQIVPLLYDTNPEKQKELHTRIESLLRQN